MSTKMDKSFYIQKEVNGITYKAVVKYWSKDYKVELVSPEFKVLDHSHMPYAAPSRFAKKGETTESFVDIEEIALNILDNYILS
ncbi:MAG: hypothetical protein U9N59_12410 [Campylobacterota bacterium]|nr:hypothetical protein [Campylobacterota bacterium]